MDAARCANTGRRDHPITTNPLKEERDRMAERERTATPGMRADLQGSPYRKDYGAKGCAGIVLAPVVLVAMALLRGGRR